MSSKPSQPAPQRKYREAAEALLESLPLEAFAQAVAQADQRKLTVLTLDVLHAHRPEVQIFNELLVQYPYGAQEEIRQVVPDNMLVVSEQPIKADLSYDLPFQPVRPFWVLDYVSELNQRKDYEENRRKYEYDLNVPYYLRFACEAKELTLYRHTGARYVAVHSRLDHAA